MLDNDQHDKQEDFLHNKHVTADCTNQPHGELNQCYPEKIIYLIAANWTIEAQQLA